MAQQKQPSLTIKWIDAQHATDKRQEIAFPDVRGLYLFIQPKRDGKKDVKSFVYRYRFNGKLRKMTIGLYSDVTLEQVRDAVSDARKLRNNPTAPKDPRQKQKEDRAARVTADHAHERLFRAVVERYLSTYASKRRGYLEKARLLGLCPDVGNKWSVRTGTPVAIWGKLPIDDVKRSSIRSHVETMAETTGYLANRTFAELRKFFNWAVEKDILPASPMAQMKPPFEDEKARNRVLLFSKAVEGSTDEELRWLWQAADAEGWPFGPLVQMLILTGQRREEVAGMTWGEIDLETREWIIPDRRTKNKKSHLVPLSDAALSILDKLPRVEGKAGYVFTTTGKSAVSGFSRMKRRLDGLMTEAATKDRGEPVSIPDWRLHDLRRTAATGMQRLGVALPVVEKVLNHISGSFAGIVGIYQTDDFAADKAKALQAWGQGALRIVAGKPLAGGENVVPMRETA